MIVAGLAVAASASAVLLLWVAWRRATGRRGPLLAALALWAAAIGLWIIGFGAEVGVPLALEGTAITGLLFILSRMERRAARAPRDRIMPEPPLRKGRWWRGLVRGIGAGPVALLAALGGGTLFATTAPFADATRLIVSGLLIPSAWAAMMVWVLASRRLLIPSATLAGMAGLTIGLSIWSAR